MNTFIFNHFRQNLIELQREIDESAIIVRDISIPLSEMSRSSRQKISKDLVEFDTINQLDIVNIYRPFYPRTAEYTLFSSTHGTFSRTNHT